jgi:Flp pilus assembly protein CpaB
VAVISASPTRALRRPLRLDVRALVGILLMLVATGGSIAVWTTQQDTRGVLVAAHDLQAGTVLTAGDLAVARARLDDALYAAALPSTDLTRVVGRQLAEPAHANQVLVRAQLSTHPVIGADQEIVSFPVRIDTAAGGRVRPGDSIQVLGTDKKDGTTRVILPRLTVYEVGAPQSTSSSSTSLSTSGASANVNWLSVIVDQQQALQLTQAKYSGDLDVALLAPQQTPNQ